LRRTIRKHPEINEDLQSVLQSLLDNPFQPSLQTHKLKGKLEGSWACSAGYDLRIVFDFVDAEEGSEKDILLIDIGTHDEVY